MRDTPDPKLFTNLRDLLDLGIAEFRFLRKFALSFGKTTNIDATPLRLYGLTAEGIAIAESTA